MAITIIFAEPRKGKTAFSTYLAVNKMFDYERNKLMQSEILQKKTNGFNLTVPKHCVFSNYDIIGRKFGYSKRYAYRFNPFKFGYANEFVKTDLAVPYGFYVIDEAQTYFNSRLSLYYPDWQSRAFEQHGHNHLDFLFTVQRTDLIDINIRELANFIEIENMDIEYDAFSKPDKVTWSIREIDNYFMLEKYLASGKTDKKTFSVKKIVAPGYILDCYDCRSCKPKFYDGHFNEDFTLNECEPPEESIQGYISYLEKFNDELPKGFYRKRSI